MERLDAPLREDGLRLRHAGDVLSRFVEEIGLDDDRPAAAVERPLRHRRAYRPGQLLVHGEGR